MRTEPAALAGTRALIDVVDDGLLLAARRHLALADASRHRRCTAQPGARA